MTLYKFFSHPAPGFHADGSFVTQDTTTSASVHKKSKIISAAPKKIITAADYFGGGSVGPSNDGGGGGGYGASSSSIVDSYNPVRDRLEEGSIVEDWIPRDASGLDEMFKLMYNRDYIAGVVVDLLAEMVWSEYDLVGIEDPTILNIYRDSMEALDIMTIGPEIAKEFMVIGRSISSMIFNKERGVFDDIICHDPSFCQLTPIPIKGFDPKINLVPSPAMRQFIESNDPRDIDARKALPDSYLNAMRAASSGGGSARSSGFSPKQNYMGAQNTSAMGVPLDPINTLFLPRRSFGYDTIGTSLFTRLITFWALEKSLINATMASARRRVRSILHVKTGIDNVWEPSAQEMDNIAGMFIQADEDPVGAVVVTRTGVDTSEIRSGQDFYKWADEWSLLNEGKLRALGANDALLCLSGDTLIPTTEHGIIRIDQFGKNEVDEKFTTVGVNGSDITKKWLYSGNGNVIELKTNSGNTIKCTPDHQILVLDNNDLIWKKASELKLNDYLCISKEKCTRQSELPLNLTSIQESDQIQNPKTMTTDLAYILGILVSEGCIDKYRIRVSNTELSILNGTKDRILKVFGENTNVIISEVRKPEDRIDKHGVLWRSNKQSYELCVWSKTIADYFRQLGVCVSNGRISKDKIVPWSILQADEESQISYLAAYIDGDGSVKRNGKEVVIYSYSNIILNQTQIMLNSHGIDSVVRYKYLRTTCGNAYNLAEKLSKYSCSTKFDNLLVPELPDRGYGIITLGIRKLIKERYVKQIQNVGFVFLNDDGQEVIARKFGKRDVTRWKHLLYRSYVANEYEDFLGFLKEISFKEYTKVIDLFSKKFKYTQLKSIKHLDDSIDVFDIQMMHNPSFVANGIIVHNSGDATYSNQNEARQFFMEKVVRLRDVLTTRIFYNKLFPLTARIHGFKKRSQSELANGIRTNASERSITQRQALEIPNNQLIIPTISWRKELISKVNSGKLDVYDKLEEKGVPIQLRDWAAAGGVDLDCQVSGLERDADLRRQVAKWKDSSAQNDSDMQEESAKLEFINSLRGLAHSSLKTVIGNVQHLGPLSSFIFWDQKATFGPLSASDLSSFLETIKPEDNSCRYLADSTALKWKLHSHFQSSVKSEIAHYLIYRSGLTPLKPALCKESICEMSNTIKSSLDKFSSHGNVYQLCKIAEKELGMIGQLSEERLIPKKEAVSKSVQSFKSPEISGRQTQDKLSGASLYSGR